MMNLDEIFLLPNLSLSQSLEELREKMKQWKDRQVEHLHMIHDQSMKELHLFYQKSLNDWDRIVNDCSQFTMDELDVYLERILKKYRKLKTIKPIQLQELNLFSIDISFQLILISDSYDYG